MNIALFKIYGQLMKQYRTPSHCPKPIYPAYHHTCEIEYFTLLDLKGAIFCTPMEKSLNYSLLLNDKTWTAKAINQY